MRENAVNQEITVSAGMAEMLCANVYLQELSDKKKRRWNNEKILEVYKAVFAGIYMRPSSDDRGSHRRGAFAKVYGKYH